jgi:hypothetical protein
MHRVRDNRSPAFHGRAFCLPVVALLLIASPFAAVAQVSDSTSYLARMDTNADGRIQLVEYQDWLSYAFDGMDRDHDGTLSPGEQPGGRGALLTREAYRGRLAETFRRQDRDHDGTLDARELAAPPR